MMKRNAKVFVLLLATVCAVGWTLYSVLPVNVRIGLAREVWAARKVSDYRLVMDFYENFVNGWKSRREVTVRNGKTVDSFCPDSKCPIFVLRDVHTVDDLFFVTLGSTEPHEKTTEFPKCVRNIAFDPLFGFPSYISIDCPNALDDEHSVQVVSFEILK